MEIRLKWPDNVPVSEFSQQFLQAMVDRMAMSYSTYGKVRDAYPDKVDALVSMRARISKYTQTKNLEWLVDAANFCMIEFMCPSIEEARFMPTTAKESPGRRWHGEGFNKDQNV